MNFIQVDAEKCKKDKICIIECPFNVLQENGQGIPEMVSEAASMCMHCGHCLAVCPTGALSLDNISPESCQPSNKGIIVDVPAMEALLKNRRSVRVYKKKPVDREQVTHLMDMLRWAPTAKNFQTVHWLLIDDPDTIRELAKMTIEYWLDQNALYPEMGKAWERGEDMILRSAPLLAIAHSAKDSLAPAVNCSIAVTSLELAATSYGLGGFWAGFLMRAASEYEPITASLSLPENHAVYAALALGYPQFQYHRIPAREPGKIQWL